MWKRVGASSGCASAILLSLSRETEVMDPGDTGGFDDPGEDSGFLLLYQVYQLYWEWANLLGFLIRDTTRTRGVD